VFKSAIALYLSVIKRECVTDVLINPTIRNITRHSRHAYHPTRDNIEHLYIPYLPSVLSFVHKFVSIFRHIPETVFFMLHILRYLDSTDAIWLPTKVIGSNSVSGLFYKINCILLGSHYWSTQGENI
jgi:hypothetical protein